MAGQKYSGVKWFFLPSFSFMQGKMLARGLRGFWVFHPMVSSSQSADELVLDPGRPVSLVKVSLPFG
jgi:hypothetical protein